MMPRMRLLKLQEESDGPPARSMNTQLRVKKTRKLDLIDPKAKKRTLKRRMRNTANRRQRKAANLKAAVKAEKRVEGQKAERRVTSTKVITRETAQGAKTEVLIRKKRSPNLITIKIEIRVTSLIKSIKRIQKEETVRGLGQSHKARKELQKTGTDLVAETGTGADLQYQKTRRKNEKKTERGAGNAAGVSRGDTTVKRRIRGEERPGAGSLDQEVQTEVRLETRTGAGAPEVRAIRETTAKNGHLIEKTENLPTKGEGVAAVLRVIEIKGRVTKAQIPSEEEQIVPPETEEAQPDQDQIVQKAKTETTARGINRALAQALTATEPVKISLKK